jgi:hypothetical protein
MLLVEALVWAKAVWPPKLSRPASRATHKSGDLKRDMASSYANLDREIGRRQARLGSKATTVTRVTMERRPNRSSIAREGERTRV